MNGKLHLDIAGASEGVDPMELEPNKPGHYIATMTVIVLPFVALVVAIGLAWWRGWFSWTDMALMLVLHSIAALGITVGFHRLLTHRSFETKDWVRGALTAAGSLAVEGTPTHWVADHRKHHDFTDEEGDPHSPHVGYEEGGWKNALKGFIHAQIGWLLEADQAPVNRYAKDLLSNRTVMAIDRKFWWFVAFALVFPAAFGFVSSGFEWQAGLTALLWAGFVRIGLTHHITWSVNSICHMYGKRPFENDDMSTNNRVLAFPTFGEAWHHNHHTFPTSAKHGLLKGQIDISYGVIKLLEKAGLAWDLKKPPPEEIRRRLKSA